LAIEGHTGINDDLNGIEKPVSFSVRGMNGHKAVVVQSLAKWKRVRLKELEVEPGTGILTDMRALRPDEEFSPIHSIYVDQWDWEKTIKTEERTMRNLKSTVRLIYDALSTTEKRVAESLPGIIPVLPDEIEFVHAEELARMYPSLTPRERENEYVRNHGAAFIAGIGGILSDGRRHDGRAPDYDDWTTVSEDGFAGLNGDIIVWNPVLECAFEISSMGIRVDRDVLLSQLEQCDCMSRTTLAFHSMLLSGELPPSMGGGIGQSRVCMFMLRKRHIGEVQVGIWPEDERERLEREGIRLL
ncbi:MAG: aspartate--ammonia ligase, partial [Bacteroidales bacterium]|nr:aspartate--ammonia ligase [Bacteroidales bacterium]